MFTFLKELIFFLILSLLVWVFGPEDTVEDVSLQIPPKPAASSGIYVQDNAGVFSAPAYSYLQSLGSQLDQKTTAQLAVVTVKSLKGAPLEEYSLQILRQWGIGSKEKNNGVLMLISTGDRKSRIEVGYGLEGALTDGLTGQIQDQYMIPYFREGNYEEGIVRGYEALARTIAREYNVQLAVSGYANHSPGELRPGADGQTTEELFEKALAEQNGTSVQPDHTQKETDSGNTGQGNEGSRGPAGSQLSGIAADSARGNITQNETTTKNVQASAGGSVSSGTASGDAAELSGKKEPEGVVDYILDIAWGLVDTFGWTVILLAFVFVDGVFLGGFFATLFLEILLSGIFSGSGGSGGGGSSGGGFGGGSGGGGGSSRSW